MERRQTGEMQMELYVEGYGYIINVPGVECGSDSDAACFVCGRCQHEGIGIYGGLSDLGAACRACIDERREAGNSGTA